MSAAFGMCKNVCVVNHWSGLMLTLGRPWMFFPTGIHESWSNYHLNTQHRCNNHLIFRHKAELSTLQHTVTTQSESRQISQGRPSHIGTESRLNIANIQNEAAQICDLLYPKEVKDLHE